MTRTIRRSRRRIVTGPLLTGVFLLLASAIAACGGGESEGRTESGAGNPQQTAATLAIDPCSLLRQEEVSQALGWAGANARTDTTRIPGMGSCEFAATGQPKKLWLHLRPASARPRADQYRADEADQKESLGVEEIQFIDGLGTAAMWVPDFRQLVVAVPSYEVSMMDMSPGNIADLSLEQARGLMNRAIARLR